MHLPLILMFTRAFLGFDTHSHTASPLNGELTLAYLPRVPGSWTCRTTAAPAPIQDRLALVSCSLSSFASFGVLWLLWFHLVSFG